MEGQGDVSASRASSLVPGVGLAAAHPERQAHSCGLPLLRTLAQGSSNYAVSSMVADTDASWVPLPK